MADLGRIQLSGYLAWLVWLFVHLMYIVEFENRVLIFLQWAWDYFTRNRMARLITGESQFPPSRQTRVHVLAHQPASAGGELRGPREEIPAQQSGADRSMDGNGPATQDGEGDVGYG